MNEADPEQPILPESQLEAIFERYNETDRVVPIDAKQVADPLPFDLSFMASGRLARASMNQSEGGDATISRYQIWAETIRGILLSSLEEIESGRPDEDTVRNLRRAINSLGAFCTIQDEVEKKRR